MKAYTELHKDFKKVLIDTDQTFQSWALALIEKEVKKRNARPQKIAAEAA